MNKKGLGQGKLISLLLFKEKFWRKKEEEQRGFEVILNQQERETEDKFGHKNREEFWHNFEKIEEQKWHEFRGPYSKVLAQILRH